MSRHNVLQRKTNSNARAHVIKFYFKLFDVYKDMLHIFVSPIKITVML